MDWSVRKTHFQKLVAIEFAPQMANFFTPANGNILAFRLCHNRRNGFGKTYLYLVAKEANGLFGLARLKFMAAPLRYVASHCLLVAALTSLTHRSSFTYNIAPQWAESINPVQRLLTVKLISDFFRTFWCICFNQLLKNLFNKLY